MGEESDYLFYCLLLDNILLLGPERGSDYLFYCLFLDNIFLLGFERGD